MPGVEIQTMPAAKVGGLSSPYVERPEWTEPTCNIDVTCPCCWTTRQEPASVLSNSVNIKPSKLYAPLNAKKREFRLLTICSGSFDDEVRCNLVPVQMGSKPSYAALSYYRGSKDERATIKVNGQAISVTQNLELALKYFRKNKSHTVIWVDAVCINQEDIVEKSSQVCLMRDIYSRGMPIILFIYHTKANSYSGHGLNLAGGECQEERSCHGSH